MKYILILLTSAIFAQVPILSIQMEKTFYDDDSIERYLDTEFPVDTVLTIVAECYKIVLDFQDGWENVFDDEVRCPEAIDVRIKVGDKTINYTAEEFLERLGFK